MKVSKLRRVEKKMSPLSREDFKYGFNTQMRLSEQARIRNAAHDLHLMADSFAKGVAFWSKLSVNWKVKELKKEWYTLNPLHRESILEWFDTLCFKEENKGKEYASRGYSLMAKESDIAAEYIFTLRRFLTEL